MNPKVRQAIQLAMTSVAMLTALQTQAAIVVHTTDFITDSNRSHFNGFETIVPLSYGGAAFTEDTITVQQINGSGATGTGLAFAGASGNRTWYSNGDYITLSRVGSIDFDEVGFHYGTGWHSSLGNGLLYELLDDGAVVLSGSASLNPNTPNYLGFSGGGFDTIRIRDNLLGNSTSLNDGAAQALIVDNIEIRAVPEPTFAFVTGVVGMIVACRKRKRSIE